MKGILLICSFLIAACGMTQSLSMRYDLASKQISKRTPIKAFVQGDHGAIKSFVESHGGKVGGTVSGYISVQLTKVPLLELAAEPYVKRVDYKWSKGVTMNDSTRVINNVSPIHAGDPSLLQSYTGQGVLLGVIDGGIDLQHGDFRFPDSTTRVLKLWKQHGATINPPTKFGYGRQYDSTDINAGSVLALGQSADHGCTVTGAAAGNANENGRHMGMAPNTDLIIVSSNFSAPNWSSTVADAVEYIFGCSRFTEPSGGD